jgi:hypothetical protein
MAFHWEIQVRSEIGLFGISRVAHGGPECPGTPAEAVGRLAIFGLFWFIQLSNSTGRRAPTRVADGHADSHDEYGMAQNNC